ncbi:GTPase family protein [Cellulomonas edaphi]|uniref:50S ribosome-binding GTPase n=1 Tax=Cellulomonas edaphi TaxID=3053468 RepID=A0ABT7SAH2_9CELL|nr:GTPase [Cellulomons edaphi]MDM7832613.1 50S ribosome-binding GTPase [Cellulomons edaphi]
MTLDLAARTGALEDALVASGDRLPAALADEARAVIGRARERGGLSAEHTVVALAGATGSGKSSLLNALVGQELAQPGVQRPTTSHALAAVWGAGADPVLDWLEVPRRHQMGAGGGLVLVDLPDHDSIVVEHRVRAERLVERADLLVWVVDPQKYADAALHERYLRPLAGHGEVTVVVLNQVDRLTPGEVAACLADLRRLVAEDGLVGARVLAVSARTGSGMDALRGILDEAAAKREASTRRWAADTRTAARRVVDELGSADRRREPTRATTRLVSGLEDAAGVPTVVEAVRGSFKRDAHAATGWPVTRWLGRFRRDPLRRLGLRTQAERPNLARTSLPTATPTVMAAARTAVRDYAADATATLPDAWALDARRRASAATEGLADALDQAVAGTALDASRRPRWWRVVGTAQWAVLGVLVVGLLWLGVLGVLDYLRLPPPPVPEWHDFPVPTLMVVGGVVLGLLLALLSRIAAAIGARRRAARAARRLRRSVEAVARDRVVAPVDGVVADLARAREQARRAAS